MARRRVWSGIAAGTIAFSGFYGIAFPNVALQLAIAEMPAGIAAITINTTPLLTYGLALGMAIERFRWPHLIGLACGFAGALLLLLPKASLPTPEMAGWVAFGFSAPFSYAIANIFSSRHRPAGDGSLAIACGPLFGAACWVVPMALAFDQFPAVSASFGAGNAAILAQVLISSIACILVFEVLRLTGAVYFSQVGYIVALTALGWGMLFFGERRPLDGNANGAGSQPHVLRIGELICARQLDNTGLGRDDTRRRSTAR